MFIQNVILKKFQMESTDIQMLKMLDLARNKITSESKFVLFPETALQERTILFPRNDSLILVDFVNKLRDEGKDRWNSLIEAGMTRLRPIILTTVTTIFGLIDQELICRYLLANTNKYEF